MCTRTWCVDPSFEVWLFDHAQSWSHTQHLSMYQPNQCKQLPSKSRWCWFVAIVAPICEKVWNKTLGGNWSWELQVGYLHVITLMILSSICNVLLCFKPSSQISRGNISTTFVFVGVIKKTMHGVLRCCEVVRYVRVCSAVVLPHTTSLSRCFGRQINHVLNKCFWVCVRYANCTFAR